MPGSKYQTKHSIVPLEESVSAPGLAALAPIFGTANAHFGIVPKAGLCPQFFFPLVISGCSLAVNYYVRPKADRQVWEGIGAELSVCSQPGMHCWALVRLKSARPQRLIEIR